MASTYTGNTGLEKIGSGEQAGAWGTTTNTNFDIIDDALNGVLSITVSGNTTLTTSDGVLSNGHHKVILLIDNVSGAFNLTIAPNDVQKLYFIKNATDQIATILQGGGSGTTVTLAAGTSGIIYADGTGSNANVGTISTDLLGDTSPQLGGNLDVNGKNINFGDAATAGSDDTLQFGASQDLKIYHDGSNSYIRDSGTGYLLIQGGAQIRLQNSTGEEYIICEGDGAVTLYHDNSAKIATSATGVNITGHVTKPNLPSFHASGIANSASSGATSNANEVITFNNIYLNNGSHFNNTNGRFTAPIAGIYYFSQSFLYDDNGSGTGALQWRKNGSLINGSSVYIVGSQFSSYVQASSAFIISLSASDYVDLFSHPAGWHVGNESTACGYLIG